VGKDFLQAAAIINFKMQLQKKTHSDKRRILVQLRANEVAKHPEALQHAQAVIAQRTADASFE